MKEKTRTYLLILGTIYLFACSMYTLCYLWYSVCKLISAPTWLLICGSGVSAWVGFTVPLIVIGEIIGD